MIKAIGAVVAVFLILGGVVLWLRESGTDRTEDLAPIDRVSTSDVPDDVEATVVVGATSTLVDDAPASPTDTSAVVLTIATTAPPETTPTATTVPVAPVTIAVPTAPTTSAGPTTTLPATTTTTVFGDLQLPGLRMTKPPCDGSYITVVGSAVDPDKYPQIVQLIVDTYPGVQYLRTDQTCPSLRADLNGTPIYVGYFGPYDDVGDACAARALGPDDAYVRILSETDTPTHIVDCP